MSPEFGLAWFDQAQFRGDAQFAWVRFGGDARFGGARFSGEARFEGARFSGRADFAGAQFDAGAWFGEPSRPPGTGAELTGARFIGDARFEDAQFNGYALFEGAQFSASAGFERALFGGEATFAQAGFSSGARFSGAQFSDSADFYLARFARYTEFSRVRFSGAASFDSARCAEDAKFDAARFDQAWIGPLTCTKKLSVRDAAFGHAVRLRAAATSVDLTGSRFTAPAVFALRYAEVDLADMVADAPVTVTWHAASFETTPAYGPLQEREEYNNSRPSVASVAGVDVANLVLSDVDVSRCVFSGAHHLDQIRLEGRCVFASAPRGWYFGRNWIPVRRWTRRKLLAEEVAWRVGACRPALSRAGWAKPKNTIDPAVRPSPAQLAVLYRQLRKALEDGKDTPGAADFYYGEMEARRHDTYSTARGERALLHAYWLVSGYALRASRALGFLAATAAATFVLMMTIGLPDNQLNPQIAGTMAAPGRNVMLTESTPDPALTLPLVQRFTAHRADQAALVVVNSVIFRSAGTDLTGSGTWIEIASRIGEPVLLGFAALAARGRVQR
jgi:hypothetical protein